MKDSKRTKGAQETDDAVHDTELLTVRELAGTVKVAERTIQNWTADGTIPSLKFGRIRRYAWTEVFRALAEGYCEPVRCKREGNLKTAKEATYLRRSDGRST